MIKLQKKTLHKHKAVILIKGELKKKWNIL